MKKAVLALLLLMGVVAHLATTSPVPQDDYNDDYDYYDDYDYNGDTQGGEIVPELEPQTQPELVVPELPEEEVADDTYQDEVLPEPEVSPEAEEGPMLPAAGPIPVNIPSDDWTESILAEVNENRQQDPVPPQAQNPVTPKPQSPLPPLQNLGESCTVPPDAGTCRGYFPMFYFDPDTRSCRQFVYGGCSGSANVYKTSADCYSNCYPAGLTRSNVATKGDYLTLHDGSDNYHLNFPGHDAALKVDDLALSEFSMSKVYQLEFVFRTDSPHGLIAFLRQHWVPPELEGTRVHLYVYLRRGRLGITHVYGQNIETFLMKKGGMQSGNWHSGLVKVNSGTGEIVMEVDASTEHFTIASLRDNPSYHSNYYYQGLTSVWIGGIYKNRLEEEEVTAGMIHFHGCLKKIGLMSGQISASMLRIKPLKSAHYYGVTEKCGSNCADRYHDLCSPASHCVEHFDHSTCNCFNSGKDGRRCTDPDIPTLSLSSDGYVVHRLYDWMDRVHSYVNLVSLQFKTRFGNAILFYASSEYPERQYLGLTLTDAGTVYIEANLGAGPVSTEVGHMLNSETWHTLTLIHQHDRIQIYLNSRFEETLIVPGSIRYFHLDPDVYIGNAPNITRYCGLAVDYGSQDEINCFEQQPSFYYHPASATCRSFNYSGCAGNHNRFPDYDSCINTCRVPGLRSLNKFLGCLKDVYVNDVSVLYELKVQNQTTTYHGMTRDIPLGTKCRKRDMELVTLSTENATISLTNPNPDLFHLIVSFKPSHERGVLASGFVDLMDTSSEWELRHDRHHVYFYVHDNLVNVKPGVRIEIGHWQYVDVKYESGRIEMSVNKKTMSQQLGVMHFLTTLTIGEALLPDYPGFVGCLRRLDVGGERINLRSLVGTPLVHRDVIHDDCQVMRPCDRPGACEHGAACTETPDGVHCDCSGTGYTGAKCHFSIYKKSCEQYRQIGYNTTGIYRVDVDGNGPLPPSFVKCSFNDFTGETTTIVQNNMLEKFHVRGPDLDDMEIRLQYRDFTDDMITTLIAQSESCKQELQYDCRRSPMALSTRTWFSSPSESFFATFGSQTPGLCRCREVDACDVHEVACNCDVADGMPRSDKAVIRDPRYLPVTGMVFMQDTKGQKEDSEGVITVGPLECTKEVAAKGMTVSFRNAGNFLEVPAWRRGSFFLSFKTTSKKAVVAYQPAYHPSHASFRIALVGDNQVEFMYSFHGTVHRHVLTTARRLNTGEWQQVLIDIHHHQLRLVVNSEQQLIDIDKDANLGVLDGSLFLGGIPRQHQLDGSSQDDLESLIGCIRGLTLNDALVDLTRYIRAAPRGVSDECQPSCQSNPCQNGAECVEMWGSYECVCKNPLAQCGKNCEHNINEDAVTFKHEASKIKYFVNDTASLAEHNPLNNSFLINFRTHSDSGLILFVHDYLHNFLQLHLASPNRIVLMFNSGKDFEVLPVVAEDGVLFNEGQSVQISVSRSNTSTSLIVYTDGAFYNASVSAGLVLLEDEDYEQFPFGESQPVPEKVYYPHSPTKPTPFLQIYLGAANDAQYDVTSDLPGLVGCIRGLKIGGTLISLGDLLSKSSFSVEGVVPNCTLACDLKPCLNGGTCTEDFQFFNNFHCDCSGTSYTGPICNSEIAYTFSGYQWISRYATVSPVMEDVVMELAFSVSQYTNTPQLISFLRSTNPEKPYDFLLVGIDDFGNILVEGQLEDLDSDNVLGVVVPLGPMITASRRHYVRMEWTAGELIIQFDDTTYRASPVRPIEAFPSVTTTPTGLYLGGYQEDIDSRLNNYDYFYGCISNVRVKNPAGQALPLLEYSENDRHLEHKGLPGLGSCSGFARANAPRGLILSYMDTQNVSAVMGPEWAFQVARSQPVDSVPANSEHPERDTPMDDVVPIVAGVLFIIVAIALLAFVCKMKTNIDRKKKLKLRQEEEQVKKPLYKTTSTNNRAKVVEVQKAATAVEMMPLTSAPDGVHQGANGTGGKMNVQKDELQKETPEEAAVAVEVRTGETAGPGSDRPLSWDKSADNLPLTIGRGGDSGKEKDGSDSGSQSSFECTLDIAGTPTHTRPPGTPSIAESSPSSTRVQRGSNTLLYIDEDLDTEPESGSDPKLIKHQPLPEAEFAQSQEGEGKDELEREDATESERPGQTLNLEEGEVQKIIKSDDENEYVIVDDDTEKSASKETESKTEDVPAPGDEQEARKDESQQATEIQKETEKPEVEQDIPQPTIEVQIHEAPKQTNIIEDTAKVSPNSVDPSTLPPPPPIPTETEPEEDKKVEVEVPDMPPPPPPPTESQDEDDAASLPVPPPPPPAETDATPAATKPEEPKVASETSSDSEGFVEFRPESEDVQAAQRMSDQLN